VPASTESGFAVTAWEEAAGAGSAAGIWALCAFRREVAYFEEDWCWVNDACEESGRRRVVLSDRVGPWKEDGG
jgi:hypothetical protein